MKKWTIFLLALLLCLPGAASADSAAKADDYRYRYAVYRSYDEGSELLLVSEDYHGTTQDGLRQQLLDAVTPNRTERIQSVASTGIHRLVIQAERCGIVVEPVEGTQFTLDYIGVANKASLPVTVSAEGGALSVSVAGSSGEDRLVRTVPGSYANVVRVGVPTGVLRGIEVAYGRHGMMTIRDLDLPVAGDVGGGSLRIEGAIREAATELTGTSGDILLTGGILRGPITASVTSGDICIDGGIVDGALDLGATNGEITIEAGVLGDASLSVKNGDIKASAGLVKQGTFTATNGAVHLGIGAIGERVDAKITSGDLFIAFTSKPTDLRYSETVTSKFAEVAVPAGWRDGHRIGEGSAALSVSLGNGRYSLTLPA